MQTTSTKFKTLVSGNYYTDVRLVIDGVIYPQSKIVKDSMKISRELFANGNISVGNCVTGELDVDILELSENIGRMATVIPYVRITDGSTYSEWLKQGVFYLDYREYDAESGVLSMTCYDAMDKLEQYYFNDSNYIAESLWNRQAWSDIRVAKAIASRIGVKIDPETIDAMTYGYKVGYPGVGDSASTCREVMSYIASFYAGNWTVTPMGKLRLVMLNSLPDETSLLIQSDGNYITVGGERIVV